MSASELSSFLNTLCADTTSIGSFDDGPVARACTETLKEIIQLKERLQKELDDLKLLGSKEEREEVKATRVKETSVKLQQTIEVNDSLLSCS